MPQSYGKALNLSDEELEEASAIGREEIALALAWLWLYSPELARMAEAEVYERDDTVPRALAAGLAAGGGRYLYLTQRGRFYDLRRRRDVDPRAVRLLLDKALDRASQGARNQVLQLRGAQKPKIDLPTWEVEMRRAVKSSTVAARVTGAGGVKRTHLEALERMQATVLEQAKFLRRFALQIETGEQPLDGRAQARAASYIQSARSAHMEARQEVAVAIGYDEQRNLRYAGDSCDGCVAMEKLGWISISDPRWVPIGRRNCLGNCRCSVAFRSSATGESSESEAA
jgi:hypothetical protein